MAPKPVPGLPDVVDHYWPHGTYSSETVTTAARAIADLVRYLNHATRQPDTLLYIADINSVLYGLAEATQRLPQLTRQLRAAVHWQVTRNPHKVYDDREGKDVTRTTQDLLDELDLMAGEVAVVHRQFQRAANMASHLGNRE